MTLTHEIDREEVMAYLDGELPAARALTVRAHINQCAECAALADDLRQVSAGLGEWQVEDAPIGLSGQRVIGSLKGASGRAGAWRFPPNWRWSLAGVALVGVLVLVVAVPLQQRARRAVPDVMIPRPSDALLERNGPLASPTAAPPRQGRGGLAASGYASGQGQQGQGLVLSGGNDLRRSLQGGPTGTTAADNQMIVRTSSLSLSTDKFDEIRAALERVATERHGSVAALTLAGDPPNRRSLSATVRVPIAEMDAALTSIRALGKVLQESQSSEDVTDSHRDLAIRIANAKVEEARLGEILKDRTGRLSDVLAVEQAQSRVRTEIEQMEAQELAMRNRAALSTISVEVQERYRAEIADNSPLPISTRLRNAVVDGARAAVESLVGFALAVLAAAPTLVLWAGLLFLPVRWLIRRMRRVRLFSAQ